MTLIERSLRYHATFPAGKLTVVPSKEVKTMEALQLAYTPGVAIPCKHIAKDPQKAYTYTTKGNLVGVVTNGTAVLGLGNLGALAAKPVMEGKIMLMNRLAGVGGFDIELDETSTQALITMIRSLAPTFGSILLEDIKAPDCFEIEQALQEISPIPVFHDDQHGTAIVVGAALKNALRLVQKDIKAVRVVINGAGAGALATASLLHQLGVPKKHICLFDSKGLISTNRTDLSSYKAIWAVEAVYPNLEKALEEADFFLGLSVGNTLSAQALAGMAPDPIVFALANPTPEIAYELAVATRPDVVMATGRSDYPNQVNNALVFPYLLRGLLDVGATGLNMAIKLAALEAIATIVDLPSSSAPLGPHYLLPDLLDARLYSAVSCAVAKAAMDTGVAQHPIVNWDDYRVYLERRLQFMLSHVRSSSNAK